MIKITEVSTDTNIGGAGRVLLILLKELDRKKFEVSVILPRNSLLKPEIEKLGVRITEVPGIADKSLDMPSIMRLKKVFDKEKPDIVHTHASMSARIAARISGAKVVYTRHSVFPPPDSISRGIGKKINGIVNNLFSDRIIAVAEAAKDNLTDTGVDESKIDVILNGVYPLKPCENKNEIFKRFGIEPGEKVISIVARLEDIKGHDYFIEAADMLIKEGYKAKFVIAGTGSYEEHLKQKVKEIGQEENIIFTGFISDVDRLMDITYIQANASFGTEATSLSLLEGMSLGVPAVVSDFGGNPGVIKSGVNGFVVKKQDAKALKEGIESLLKDDKLYEKLSQGSKKIFNEAFTAQAMTRNTECVYEKVIGGKNNEKIKGYCN